MTMFDENTKRAGPASDLYSTELRDNMIDRLNERVFDVIVIGGGINGAVSAAAAAAKNAKVALLEAGDFASSSSQESSTLAWGGIKYLENYEFKLVWDLCKSRNELMRCFPSSVVETRFLAKIDVGFRKPAFLIFLGTILYWIFGRFKTKRPQYHNAQGLRKIEPKINLQDFGGAFSYSDCVFLDGDARFTFNFIKSAIANDAVVSNYMLVKEVKREKSLIWEVISEDVLTGKRYISRAKSIVNATGANADKLVQKVGLSHNHKHVLSKGAHIIVPAITSLRHVITSFSSDGRLFFALPMAGNTCIGTTDEIVADMNVEITDADRKFILDNANKVLDIPVHLTKSDIIAERCGVRPLVISAKSDVLKERDAFDISRKHIIESTANGTFVTIYGGKITDCINTGSSVCKALGRGGIKFENVVREWYGEAPLQDKVQLMARQQYVEGILSISKNQAKQLLERWWRYYENAAHDLIDRLNPQSRVEHLQQLVTNTEKEFIRETEMALSDMDILRRRTNLIMSEGLFHVN